MNTNLKHCVWALAVVVGMGVGVGTAPAVAAPQDREHQQQQQQHEQDYSKNKTYQQGMREGRSDHARSLDHSRNRRFKKDVDRKAYEAGYQKGRG
jgi:biotin-(acetyl-CoA carboxylase) ligase